MEKYSVYKLESKIYNYLIIANSYENPINDFLSLGSVDKINNGTVIFDLTLINGVNNNRYMVATVSDNKLIFSSIKPTKEVDDITLDISSKHFLNNSSIVENSVIPNALKYHILHL